MRQDQLGHAIVDLGPHFVARDRTQFVARHFHRQIHLAAMADVDDVGIRRKKLATSSMGFTVAERPMRCGFVSARASNRASDSARCEPRLSSATA